MWGESYRGQAGYFAGVGVILFNFIFEQHRTFRFSLQAPKLTYTYPTLSYSSTSPILQSERLRRWSNKPDVVGSIPDTTEFFLISCDSNQVPKWFGTHYNLEVPL